MSDNEVCCLVESSLPLYEINTVLPISQMRKRKLRELKGHVQVYPAGNPCWVGFFSDYPISLLRSRAGLLCVVSRTVEESFKTPICDQVHTLPSKSGEDRGAHQKIPNSEERIEGRIWWPRTMQVSTLRLLSNLKSSPANHKGPKFGNDWMSQLQPAPVCRLCLCTCIHIHIYPLLPVPRDRYGTCAFFSVLQKQQMDNCSP